MATIMKDDEASLFKASEFIYIHRKIQENEEAQQTDIIRQTINAQG